MKKPLQTLVFSLALLASHLVAGQAIRKGPPSRCGTPDITSEYLAAHPKTKARLEAIEAQTQRYIEQAGLPDLTAQKVIGPPQPLITIPVVVHVIYSAADQNLSDAVISTQMEALNFAFRGRLNPGPNGAPVPAAFVPRVGDARVSFCLATRDPNGNPTTGITRRSTSVQAFHANGMKSASTGGTDAWNTAHYLNIWVCNVPGFYGYAVFPGMAAYPGEDGIVMSYTAFGRGHAALDAGYDLGRVAIHEVGHWLNVRHIWGDDGAGCSGSDLVSDTPNQDGYNSGNPVFPRITCSNGPNGDMFMNHMDYVSDDSRLMFSAGQALRMQAVFGPGGYRESLKNSPGLMPSLSIASQGLMPTTVFCGDKKDYKFRVGSASVGCAGGAMSFAWTATNGWTVAYPNNYYPQITPSGTSGSTITLAGTYTNANGTSFPLNPVSVVVGFNPALPAPVFKNIPPSLCGGSLYILEVTPVAGASSYLWTVPPGFSATGTGPVTTTAPTLPLIPDATLAGGFYALTCQAQGSGCTASAPASVPLTVNGGPQLRIVDSDPDQRYQGVVCQQNFILLELVPVGPVVPGAFNGSYTSIRWSSSSQGNYLTGYPLQIKYLTEDVPNGLVAVTAEYIDACGNRWPAVPYSATTAPAGSTSLGNGYSCGTYQWRPAPTALVPTAPYPNPVAGTLHLPSYQGPVVVYNQQGKPVHRLLAPGTDTGATVDTSTWPEGLYVVTGRNLTGAFQRHNVQIQR